MNIWLTDPKTGEKSVTLTTFVVGVGVALVKLLFAGVTLGPIQVVQFTGGDFAAVVGALGTIYAARKYTDKE